jgi:LemA protein
LAIIAVIFFVFQYNAIISIKNKVGESFSAIDTVLQNRYNIIPNLVEIVKQYASHEKEVFENVSKMRSELLANSGK